MPKPVAVSSKSSAQQSSTCVWPLGVGASGRCWHLALVPAYFLTHLPLNLVTHVPLLRRTCCLGPAGKASVLRVDPGAGPGLVCLLQTQGAALASASVIVMPSYNGIKVKSDAA